MSKNDRELIRDLTYESYKANRDMSPHISVERWGLIYPNVEQLERRYQEEKRLNQIG